MRKTPDTPAGHRQPPEFGPFHHVAYVKTVEVDGQRAYAIFDGEGRQIGVAADRDVAFAAARQHDFEPLSVH